MVSKMMTVLLTIRRDAHHNGTQGFSRNNIDDFIYHNNYGNNDDFI